MTSLLSLTGLLRSGGALATLATIAACLALSGTEALADQEGQGGGCPPPEQKRLSDLADRDFENLHRNRYTIQRTGIYTALDYPTDIKYYFDVTSGHWVSSTMIEKRFLNDLHNLRLINERRMTDEKQKCWQAWLSKIKSQLDSPSIEVTRPVIAAYVRNIKSQLDQMDSLYGYKNNTMLQACRREGTPAWALAQYCDGNGLYLGWTSARSFYLSHLEALDQVASALTWRRLSPDELKYYARGMQVWRRTDQTIANAFEQQIAESLERYKLLENVHVTSERLFAISPTDESARTRANADLVTAQQNVAAYENAHFKADFLTAGRFVAFNGVQRYRTSAPVRRIPVPSPMTTMPQRH